MARATRLSYKKYSHVYTTVPAAPHCFRWSRGLAALAKKGGGLLNEKHPGAQLNQGGRPPPPLVFVFVVFLFFDHVLTRI